MPKFNYSIRSTCVCGNVLAKISSVIRRDVEWGEVKFSQCEACGSWCQCPQITLQSISDWYDSDEYRGGANKSGSVYVDYLKDEPCRLREGRNRYLRDLVKFLPSGKSKILEVGCATGSLLAAIREFGHDVSGLDLSSRFVREAKQLYGLNIQTGDIMTTDYPQHHFDMIIMLGTISNLWNIPESLLKIRIALKPGGSLVFNNPTSDSLVARLYGQRYWMFGPSVSTFMSIDGCRRALINSGFRDFHITTDRQMPSFSKVLNHVKLPFFVPLAECIFRSNNTLPFAIPIPGVKLFRAKTHNRSENE